jgi:hypothetical protein
MMECVVDTGSSQYVARRSQTPEADSAHSIPYMNNSGVSANAVSSTMPPLMVDVTPRPSSSAPRNCSSSVVLCMVGSGGSAYLRLHLPPYSVWLWLRRLARCWRRRLYMPRLLLLDGYSDSERAARQSKLRC